MTGDKIVSPPGPCEPFEGGGCEDGGEGGGAMVIGGHGTPPDVAA